MIPCAVIEGPNGEPLRVLSESGITNALLGSRSGASKRIKKKAEDDGARLPLFLAPSQLKPFIDKDLADGPLQVIEYLDGDRVIRAYNAEVLVAVCEIWLKAREAGMEGASTTTPCCCASRLPQPSATAFLHRRRLTPRKQGRKGKSCARIDANGEWLK